MGKPKNEEAVGFVERKKKYLEVVRMKKEAASNVFVKT